ncbi:PDZ domain-containing protein [Undibacterium sp. Di27W]|uniref:PDZ domain-containing protein n=1 Tax=Undibacterium sp. Di27W TaxID=3413036 RepID=UPI003BF29A88
MKKFLALCLYIVASMAIAGEDIVSVAKYDQYSKATGIATTAFIVPDINSFWNPAYATAHLAGNVSDQGAESMWLRVYYHSGNWKFFDSAKDIDGNTLTVSVIDRRIQAASLLVEEFSAQLSRDYIERHKDNGFDFRFQGKGGQLIVKLPSDHVQTFLAKLTEVEADVRGKLAQLPTKIEESRSNSKPKLGVKFVPVTDGYLQYAKLPSVQGVVIVNIEGNSLAQSAGILPGDIIEAIGGEQVASDLTSLQNILGKIPAGAKVQFKIMRASQKLEIPVQF